MRVVPAILANDLPSFTSLVRSAEGFSDYVQIDIMDGLFVPSRSIDAAELSTVKTTVRSEAHLMVKNPEDWLEAAAMFGCEEILFHYEAVEDPAAVVKLLRETDFRAGLAVNPETRVADIIEIAGSVDSVMFMAVNPGFYGAPFIPEVMDNVRELRRLKPSLDIGVDGGIKLSNAVLTRDAGADYVCVGSAIFKAEDPGQAYCQFKQSLNPHIIIPGAAGGCD
ncbi:MAG: ribulose-phosphate 3-epimerase [Actinomycetota bacterium]